MVNDFFRWGNIFFIIVFNYLKNLLESYGIFKDKIILVYNIIYERFFLNRKIFNYFKKDGIFNLLVIGCLIELKGYVYLLKGFKYFIDNYYVNVYLIIVYG